MVADVLEEMSFCSGVFSRVLFKEDEGEGRLEFSSEMAAAEIVGSRVLLGCCLPIGEEEKSPIMRSPCVQND